MIMNARFAVLALGMIAAPLSAQLVVRSGGEVARRNDKIPPGQLPPRGLCRVWIDGVPPGQQPPVTDCATAERNRVANSHVIYGDRETFRGRAKSKVERSSSDVDVARRCTVWDAVVVDGRVVNVCRDDNVLRDGRGRAVRRGDQNDDDDDNVRGSNRNDDNKIEKGDKKSKVKANKANKKDKKGDHDDGDQDDGGHDDGDHNNGEHRNGDRDN